MLKQWFDWMDTHKADTLIQISFACVLFLTLLVVFSPDLGMGRLPAALLLQITLIVCVVELGTRAQLCGVYRESYRQMSEVAMEAANHLEEVRDILKKMKT